MYHIRFDLRITVSATKTSPVWWSYFFIIKKYHRFKAYNILLKHIFIDNRKTMRCRKNQKKTRYSRRRWDVLHFDKHIILLLYAVFHCLLSLLMALD